MSNVTGPHGRPHKCVVVGAGVVGVTTAYRLAQAGADVTLVDGSDVGGGASGATFAHVNASYAGYWNYVELRRAGLEGYGRFRQEAGGAPWWHESGYLSVHRASSQVADLDRHLERLVSMGYPAARVSGQPSALEPALSQLDAERTYHFPDEGYVDVDAMLADLVGRARELGVQVRTGDPVTALLTSGQGVTGARLRSGESLACDELIVASGRWTDDVLALAGLETSYVAHNSALNTPVPGLLVVTDAVHGSVSKVVSVDDFNYRPYGENQTMVWSGTVDRQLQELGGENADPDVPIRLGKKLLAAASEIVPVLKSVPMREAMVTARAMPADGQPIVGRPPGIQGVYVVLAHAAVTLAPALADFVVTEVIHGRTDDRLDRFRPERLVSSDTHTSDNERKQEDLHDPAGKR